MSDDDPNFALVAGLAFLAVGALGFVPAAVAPAPPGAPPVRFDAAYGYLLGLFPVNMAHSLVHLAIGRLGRHRIAARDAVARLCALAGGDLRRARDRGAGAGSDVAEARQDLRRAA